MSSCELAIVGAGPAGMAAAIAAAKAGASVTLIDENATCGGQIYRQPPTTIRPGTPSASKADVTHGEQLRRELADLGDRVKTLFDASVWGLFPGNQIAVQRAGGWEMIDAQQLVLAPGAYELTPPFPGWTLPGVMTPGAAQSMVKSMGVLPGRRAIIAGSGPFLLVVANQLHEAGVEVVAVVEAVRRRDMIPHMLGLLSDRSLLRQGREYLAKLKSAGIPVLWGHMVTEAHDTEQGEEQLARVSIAPCDGSWRTGVVSATYEVDTLCVGYGFVPRTELAQLAGCEMRYVEEQGGWIPQVDETYQTSIESLRMVGDGGGVAGAIVAEAEGRIAGLAAARDLEHLDADEFASARHREDEQLAPLRRFRRTLDQIYRIRPAVTELAKMDTIVCRCEELTRQQVEQGIEFGGTSLRTLKVATRLGMGPCQGKMCWPSAARLIAAQTGKSVEACGPVSVRPPVGALEMSDLLSNSNDVQSDDISAGDVGAAASRGSTLS